MIGSPGGFSIHSVQMLPGSIMEYFIFMFLPLLDLVNVGPVSARMDLRIISSETIQLS